MTPHRTMIVAAGVGLTALLTSQVAASALPHGDADGSPARSTVAAATAAMKHHPDDKRHDDKHHDGKAADDSLRALAGKVGLRMGVAVNTDLLGTDKAYTGIVNDQFSSVTPENVMKWEVVEPTRGTYDWAAADRLVASARAHGQAVRGHTLVWHSQLPSWISTDGGMTSPLSSSELRAVLKKHVQDEVRHFKGRIWAWDVVNEAFNDDGTPRQDVWYKAFGNSTDYIAQAFRWAHEVDPKADLFYNDYNIEFTGPKSNAVYAMVKKLKADRVPIAGVGFQGHLSTQYGFPDLRPNLERFSALGVDVAMTELDVRTSVAESTTSPGTYTSTPTTPLAAYTQQAYWSQSLQACLLVKHCVSYTVWGVADSNSWIPGVFRGEGAALLWDDNYQPKAQFSVLQQDLELAAGAPRGR